MTLRRYALRSAFLCLVMAASFQTPSAATHARADEPETVMVTLQAKPGAEAALADVVARHWETARRLNMVNDTPHLTMRSQEQGGSRIVDIFTWRDASIPDAAPREIQSIWAEMNRLVEARGGQPGLSITPMTLIVSGR